MNFELPSEFSYDSMSNRSSQSQVKVKVTLRLAVYCQSFRLVVRPPETHDTCGNSPYVTFSTTRGWVLKSSQSHIATDGQSISKSWCRSPSGAHDQIFITVWQLRSCFCGTPSLTRGWVCLLYTLMALANVVFLGSESLGTRDHIFCLRFETSFSSPPTTRRVMVGEFEPTSTRVDGFSKSESHCDWRSVSLSVMVSSPVRGSWPDNSYWFDLGGVRPLWREGGGALSVERVGLSFVRVCQQ
jgi:hypothetical protein